MAERLTGTITELQAWVEDRPPLLGLACCSGEQLVHDALQAVCEAGLYIRGQDEVVA